MPSPRRNMYVPSRNIHGGGCQGLGQTLCNHVIYALTTEVCKRVRKYTPYNLSNRSVVSLVNLHSRSCEDLVISVVFIKTFIIHLETSLGYFLLRPENSRKRANENNTLASGCSRAKKVTRFGRKRCKCILMLT